MLEGACSLYHGLGMSNQRLREFVQCTVIGIGDFYRGIGNGALARADATKYTYHNCDLKLSVSINLVDASDQKKQNN